AAAENLKFKEQSTSDYRYGYFVDYVIDEADRILKEEGLYDNPQDAIFKGGLNIYTTLDPDLQEYSESIYSDPANFPPDKKGIKIESAMAIVDNRTGEVRALIGGREYSSQRGFNRATSALRQPGSSIKPLVVYGPALEAGISPDYVLEDSLQTYNFWGQSWTPKNYDGKYRGPISMRTAVQWSVNTYAVKLANQIGIKNGVEFAEKCGINTLVKAGASNDMNLSTALGGITRGVSPLEMASAYSTFANQGVHAGDYVISKIVDSSGNTIYEHNPEFTRVMKKETAWAMTDLLVNVVNAGTGTKAKIPNVKCAGKTGTTQNDKDAWFVGYTPYYSCAVWIGNDKGSTTVGSAGGTYPAKIWRAIMVKAIQGKSGRDFGPPEGAKQVAICTKSGKLATAACPDADIEMKYLTDDKIPKENCDLHIQIPICSESGKMASIYCPNPVSQGFLKDAPPGDPEAPPSEYCDIHTADNSTPNPNFNNNPTTSSTTDSRTGQQHKVYICRDPRHNGTVYRAIIPNPAESGGCPPGAIEEITIDNPDALPYCNLPDHQINR
ncbi:MAG: transglycosylase domain-containing protein, partial [Candidatus Saccharibacteria bacterium]